MSFAKTPKQPFEYAHLPVLAEDTVDLRTPLMRCLYQALTVRRPSGGLGEARFVAWLVNRLPVTMIDEAGNVHVDLRKAGSRTMFTAHTDTVHRNEGANVVRVDGNIWRADENSCLGADDGAGVALLYHMILAKVPGYYVFFRGEEVGGVGSTWLATHMPELCREFDRCVSFDRAGYNDIITHQAMQRCCSDAFAQCLANELTTDDMSLAFVPDSTGVFTDSANLTELIPECTNVSIGYGAQHGEREWQDVAFLQLLASALVKVKWDGLPVERDPDEVDGLSTYGSWGSTKLHNGYVVSGMDEDTEFLVGALESAIAGYTTDLRWLIAERAMPDQADLAFKHVEINRLDEATMQKFRRGLVDGDYDVHMVLDVLVADYVS